MTPPGSHLKFQASVTRIDAMLGIPNARRITMIKSTVDYFLFFSTLRCIDPDSFAVMNKAIVRRPPFPVNTFLNRFSLTTLKACT